MDGDKMVVDAVSADVDAVPETPQPVEASEVVVSGAADDAQTEAEPTSDPPPKPIENGEVTAENERPLASQDVPPDSVPRSESLGLLLQPTPTPTLTPTPTPLAMDSTPTLGPLPPPQRAPAPVYMDPPNPSTPLDRPLNVTDALSYLDAVKVQFQDQPDVYNRFLDIMKEFKSQLIDTPGVIKRVSHLFNGHPSLIQGFNTFLPIGYRIECSTDAHDANFITVTTPTGTTMHTTNNGPGKGPILWSTTQSVPAADALRPSDTAAFGSGSGPENGVYPTPLPPASPEPKLYGVDGQAIEPAVQYVQKIKQRCDAETYRQFLDILSRYHHEPETIDEREVSIQIAQLFKDAPDLRSDFRIFMPEKSQQLFDDDSAFPPPPVEGRNRTGTPTIEGKGKRKLEVVAGGASGTSANAGSGLPQKRKRKLVDKEKDRDKEIVVISTNKAGPSSKVKKPKHPVSQDLTPSSYNHSKYNTGPPSPRRSTHPAHSQPQPPSRVPSMNDETHFFDRVKRSLENRDTYNEFLKVVNLFTQDYIDTAKLMKESRNFLGDGDLLRQFQEIVGWDDRKDRESWMMEQHQHGWTRPEIGGVLDRPTRADLNVRYGSYRKLPASEVNVTCSGRDEMCRSVLNDEWVSHPTWSSEDSGFVAHKKNMYEEALHRSEEERHEYDFHIEAIVRTITMLEPINNKIAQLSLEERGNFKLKPNLGGSGKSIHHRVVKKIYGREAGLEVIQAMQDSPALAIPMVLQRLKQKEEEWKRAQREWNKVWREVDARNYQKSLDHQGISFKAADKKAITTKAFVSQIEAAREEQVAKRASLIDPLFARTRPRHQLEYVVEDVQVLQDALKLTFSFLDRTQAQINFTERKRIESFLRSFVPLFFMLDPVSFNSAFAVVQETVDSDMSDDVGSVVDDAEVSSVASSSSKPGRSHRKGAGAASSGGDLRKKLLKSEQAKSTNRKTRAQEAASPSVSRLASPALPDDEPRTDNPAQNRRTLRKNIFFTNTIFYTLLRLLEVVYIRLSLFKRKAAKLASGDSTPRRRNPIAETVGLPSSADFTNFGDRTTNAEHFYELLLESCERLFDNEVEQHAFEDQMRYMFGPKDAYKIFTIDKLIGAIIKQVQTVFADARSQDLLEILKRERALACPTTQDQINSRRNAEKVLGPDENLFRIDWLPDSKTMTIQLIGKDDSSFDDSEVLTGRWQSYIDSFVSSEATEKVASNRMKPPFLRRNMPPAAESCQPDVIARGGLEIKVCIRTYRLFFVRNSEDFLFRIPNKDEVAKASKHLQARNILRQKWMKNIETPS